MRHLAGTVDELRGKRAARWVRESTPGQFDRYGPEAQRELQDQAIRSLGLTDTGLEWRAAHSGRTVYKSPEMAGMMAAAERGEFEVLLVGYVSRWQRNLRRTLELLEDTLHPAGVAVYFADEEILSSNDRHWDQLVDEAKDAERFSRKHSRRVREGYASKRTKEHDPGGRPPFGFRRNEAKLVEPDPDKLATVRRVFELSAAGNPDRVVAAQTGLGLFTVRGILTSPLYVGRLRDGSQAHWPALVDQASWELVQAQRAQRATNAGRAADPRRPYALAQLHCAACGTRLTGDTGYYRHRQPCQAFVEAAPASKPRRGRTNGHAYAMDSYEGIVDGLLGKVTLDAAQLAAVVAYNAQPAPGSAQPELDRISRERQRALDRYLKDRDAARLGETMTTLDRDQAAIQAPKPAEPVPADVAVAYLRELPKTWARAKGGQGRAMLATALFDRIDVLGMREATVHLSAHAVRHGLAAVLPAEFDSPVNGRGERRQTDTGDLNVPLALSCELIGGGRWMNRAAG
jgi:DNA invertase Pin-like site-specific DNA recombinase